MTGLHFRQFREEIVKPSLQSIGLWSEAAEMLVAGTAVQESGLRFLKQLKAGPALGLYQMEPATYYDVLTNFLAYRPELKAKVAALMVPERQPLTQLVYNLDYATALCRVHYLRDREPLPEADDIDGLAATWKRHYNTRLGRGTAAEFADNLRRALAEG